MKARFYFLRVLLFALALFPVQGNAEAVRFFESIQDLPLMPGLIERANSGVQFDKPGGRIVESYADLNGVSGGDVQAYYAAALPQFGWQLAGENRFIRGEETLEFAVEGDAETPIFRVLIQPR